MLELVLAAVMETHQTDPRRGPSTRRTSRGAKSPYTWTTAVFGSINQNSKKKFRHLHGDLNLDEIKNALRLLPVNRETNLMNLIRS